MRVDRAPHSLMVLLLVALASCEDVVADEGSDAALRVTGGQFVRGGTPADRSGPPVKGVALSPIVHPGSVDRTCSGVLERTATSVALSIEGDVGYWIVPAGLADVTAPGFPTFAAQVSFASSLGTGRRLFVARGVDAAGHFGGPLTKPLDVTPAGVPTGKLVVRLSWNVQADLDLHVIDPSGVEIWKRNINSYEPPPPGSSPEPPGTPHPGGILDFDSMASCVPDGRLAENVVYADKPRSGRYLVRVDTASLCSSINAPWRVEALLDGRTVGAAEGISSEVDTRYSQDRGAGILALSFEVP